VQLVYRVIGVPGRCHGFAVLQNARPRGMRRELKEVRGSLPPPSVSVPIPNFDFEPVDTHRALPRRDLDS
jgi:hypothetical protein